MPTITASMLYNVVACPHRVTLDLFESPAAKDPVSPFVQLLWERGNLYEANVIAAWKSAFTNLKTEPPQRKVALTLEAMRRGEPLIYGGRIEIGDQVGEPDLLKQEDGGYVPIDIKSGAGEEGEGDDSKPKKHYAVQLGLYVDVLEQLGFSAGRHAYVYDIHGQEVRYDFEASYGKKQPRTLWQDYQEALVECRQIVSKALVTTPALSSVCNNCHWYEFCLSRLQQARDLTLLPELGRSRRDVLIETFPSIEALARANAADYVRGKKTQFEGIGVDSLAKFQARAALASSSNPVPYLKERIDLAAHDVELFFDIEVDPLRDFCYLHGFVVREGRNNASERYQAFFAGRVDSADERDAFAEALAFIRKHAPCGVYYYSPYERTVWRKLAEKYPEVSSSDEILALFASAEFVDLYSDVTRSKSEWPTQDYSIKTLAKYLGFKWRDSHPSGAASIEWFDRWVKEAAPGVRTRILEYNEDDCRATRILLDGIRSLRVAGE